jgi:hypothetical protein
MGCTSGDEHDDSRVAGHDESGERHEDSFEGERSERW